MDTKNKRFILTESEIPTTWYNIVADMKNKPRPILHPGTKQPMKAEDLYPIFAKAVSDQEMNQTDPFIEIPEAVREEYKKYRYTPSFALMAWKKHWILRLTSISKTKALVP